MRNDEDRETVDLRERKVWRLVLHILDDKYVLYMPGSYTTPNGKETLTQSLSRQG